MEKIFTVPIVISCYNFFSFSSLVMNLTVLLAFQRISFEFVVFLYFILLFNTISFQQLSKSILSSHLACRFPYVYMFANVYIPVNTGAVAFCKFYVLLFQPLSFNLVFISDSWKVLFLVSSLVYFKCFSVSNILFVQKGTPL